MREAEVLRGTDGLNGKGRLMRKIRIESSGTEDGKGVGGRMGKQEENKGLEERKRGWQRRRRKEEEIVEGRVRKRGER